MIFEPYGEAAMNRLPTPNFPDREVGYFNIFTSFKFMEVE